MSTLGKSENFYRGWGIPLPILGGWQIPLLPYQ